MASALNAKKVDSDPLGAHYSRPSRIPVRTGHSSGSASDDSDTSSKSESKLKTGGKSHLPVPVKSPAKKVVHSSKAGTSGSESDPEKNSTKGVAEKVVPATEKSNIKSEATGAEPVKKMPARLKSLKLKKTSSVNQARCVNPLSRSVIPDIKEKQIPAKASSGALAFVQQGRLRPARKFQAKKADDLPEEEQGRPSGGIGRKTSFRNIHSPELLNKKKCDEAGKKVNNVGLKNSKKTSPSSNEKPNSSRTGSNSKTTSNAATTKKRSKSHRKNKESDDSESDNSLGLKPRKLDFFYEAESDDLVSTDSEPPCAPKEVQSKKVDLKEENNEDFFVSDNLWLLNRKFDYEDGSDFFTTDSESECAPKEDQSVPRDVPSQREEMASNCEDSQQRSAVYPKDLESQDGVVPSTSTIVNAKMPRGFDDNLKMKIDFTYEESSYSEDSEEDSDKKEDHLEDGGKETTALSNCQMVSNEDTNEDTDKKKDHHHDGGKETTALSNCQMVSSVTSSSIDDDDTSDDSISALSDDSFWDTDVKKPSKPEKAIEKSAEFILAASELESLKKDIKPENEIVKTDLKHLQVVDDCQCTGNNSSHDSGNEAVVDAMKDVVSEKDVQPSTPIIVENQDDQVVKIGSSPSEKDNEPVNKKEMKRDIAGKKNKFESTDEDSFIEELDELLSAAEAEIEEASQKDEASVSTGKEASTLDNKVTDTPILQQTEAYDMISEPVQDVCVDGMVTASNETKTTAGKPSGSEKDERSGNVGDKKKDVAGGSSSGRGSSVGGSGDGDDPNDPWKPKPRKEPEDKKGDDNDNKEKTRAAKEALDKQMVGITEDLLHEECVGTSTDKSGKQQTALKPEHCLGEGTSSMQIKAVLQEVKASQTEEEGNVETLQKTIRSKDKEIALMQNLVDCCRKDYEELQESFNQYSKDFKEVDENRAKIGALRNENNTLKQENSKLKNQMSQKTSEATQAQEKSKKLKNMLSKMEVDLGFLETEKKELLTKLRKYEAKTPPEKVQVQKTEDKKEHEMDKNRLEHGLGRSCSLQNVEAMKAEEENVELKNKIHQCEASLKAQKKECADLKEKIATMTKTENQIKSRFQRMKEENDVLNSKCSQLVRQWKEASIGDRIGDLKKLQGEISEASKALLTDGADNELKVTSSPLSVELAEADTFSQTQQPGTSLNDQSSELQTLIESLIAMTEELREKINKTNAKLTKAYSENGNSEAMKKYEELVKQLNEEIAGLHETMEEEAAKFQQLEWIIKSSNTERQRLEERIEELEKELYQAEDNLSETTAAKDQQLNNAKHDIEMKQLKVDELLGELQMVLEGNDVLRSALEAQNLKLDRRESEEKDLKKYIDELELENETLMKELSEQKIKLLDFRRENIEKEEMPKEEFEILQNALKNKIDLMNDVMSNVEQISENHPFAMAHPCTSDMEIAVQILYDISGLLKAIGNACLKSVGCSYSSNAQVPGPSSEEQETVEGESRFQKLESMVADLKEQLKNLEEENLRLEKKVKEKRVRFTEDTKGGEADEILRLREQLQERELQLDEFEEQMIELQAENDTLTEYLGEVRDKAVRDTEDLRRQVEMHLNHIQKLQGDCESQRLCVKSLKTELSERKENNETLNRKLKDIVAEKKALEQKLEAVKDNESSRRQTEIHLNHIQKLQGDCENQRLCVKSLKGELSELKDKNASLDKTLKHVAMEKEVLEQKLESDKDAETFRRQTEIHFNHMQKLQGDCENQRRCVKSLKGELSELKEKNATLDETLKDVVVEKQTLEQKLKAVDKTLKDIVVVKQDLEQKLESNKVNESSRRQTEIHLNDIQKLQGDCENQRLSVKNLKGEISELKEKNATLDKKLKHVAMEKEVLEQKLEAVKDAETFHRQTEIHFNHMQKLQGDCENQRRCVKSLKGELSELKNKNASLDKKLKDVAAEKQALEQKLKAFSQEIQKEESVGSTPSTSAESEARIMELQTFNEKLSEKIDMFEAFFEQVKEDKVQNMKAMEASRQNAIMLKSKSEEQIAELEKTLADKNVLETKLQDTVTSLEKRISTLEAEKLENENQVKAMVESMQGQNELEKCKKEWVEMEVELRNSILALTTEKSEAQKELVEHKSAVAKASESLEFRMKELDECLQDRQALQEELACLKSTHSKQKEELEKTMEKMGQDVDEREAEVKLVRQSSSEIINELEKQLKGRQDSEIELQERAETLNKQIDQLKAEKLESDKKIQALMESIEAKEIKIKLKKLEEDTELKENLSNMEVKISELATEKENAEKTAQHDIMLVRKESEEKITALEKRLQDQSESETMLQEKVQSLESRISQLNAEKVERDDNMKTLMEAMDANKNLEENLKKKEELGRELASKVEEMRLKFSKIRSTKKHLEHQLTKKDSEFLSSSRNLKLQSKQLQDDLDGCAEREKELNERLQRLTEDNRKAEERESEALLAKKSSDDKIRVLEKQMLSKGQSEQDLKERMSMLEDKISRLEAEKSQHCKNISSMLRKLKSKEDLTVAITARDEAEREYKIKIDEMEVIVNMLRKEKNKADCDEEVKERYREEYEESQRNVRRLTENVNRCNERVKELQSFVNETVEDDEPQHLQKPTLQENIEDLKRSLKASDIELFKTLQSLNQKITHLEDEKAEGEKMITSMLKSMEDKEKIEHCIATSRGADKKMILRMNEMADAIQRLRIEKKRVEHELQNSEKQRAAKECESELLQSQTDEKISSLQKSLKERYESEWEIQKRLEAVSEKLAHMESAKEQADKTIQTMLESLQWKDNLEQCLEEKDKIEKELKRRVQELKLENKEALLEAKLYRGQCRDAHKIKEQISSLKEQLLQMEAEKDKDIESLKELLQQKEEQLELLRKTLKEEVFKLKLQKKDLEIETKKSQIQARDAFELIQKRSHEFDECLNVRNESSDRMMAEMDNLKESLKMTLAERDELENKAKKYAKFSEEQQEKVEKMVQREVEVLQKLSDAHKVIEELQAEKGGIEEELIRNRMEKTETVKRYEEKIKKLCETLKLQSDQEKDLRHVIDSLRKQTEALEDEKENVIQEGSKVVESLNMELGVQSRREMELKEQLVFFEDEINQLRNELDEQAKREVKLREEKILEIQKVRLENDSMSESLRRKVSEMNGELMKHITKENDLRVQVESARVEKEKLLLEVEELNNDKSSSTRTSRKLISELRKSENELLEKIEEMNLTVKTLEGEKRRISMEYNDYQSDILNITQTSRDANKRMHEDIKILRDNNNNLHAQLRELKLNESCLLREKQVLQQQNEENENKITQVKNKVQKQKNEITRLEDREGELKNETLELRSKISATEDKRVRDKAEYKSRENAMVFEAKVANSKIEDLQLFIKKRYKAENKLKDDIEDLKDKISELNRAVESEQLDKVEITKKHNFTKGHVIELEHSIEKKDQEIKRLDRSSEELRAQILRLQQEKQQISDSLDGCKTFLSHRNAEVHILEGKLSDQDALLTTCKRHNVELTNLRDEMMTNSMILGSRLDLIRVRQFQERNAQELKDLQKPWDKNSSNRKYLENRGSNNTIPNIQTSSYENSSTLTSTA